MLKSNLIAIILLLVCFNAKTQDIPVKTWRSHYSFYSAKQIFPSNNSLIGVANSGVFVLDLDDNSITELSKQNALSDQGVSFGNADAEFVVLGYKNGNIDILKENKITNINDIKFDPNETLKEITDVDFNNEYIIVTASFGPLLIGKDNLLIKEAYTNIVPNQQCFSSALFADSIFVGLSDGIMSASMDPSENRKNPEAWHIHQEIPEQAYKSLVTFNSQLYALGEDDSIYRYNGQQWTNIKYGFSGPVNSLSLGNNQLLINEAGRLVASDGNTTSIIAASKTALQYSSFLSGRYWLADVQEGFSELQGNSESPVFNQGPYTDTIFSIDFNDKEITVSHGGYDNNIRANGSNAGFSTFTQGKWNISNPIVSNGTTLGDFNDIVGSAGYQGGPMYYASASDGLMKIDNDQRTIFNESNSPLRRSTSNPDQIMVRDVKIDPLGNAWVINYDVNNSLHKLEADGNWSSFSFPGSASSFPKKLAITGRGVVCFSVDQRAGGGILVFDQASGVSRLLTTQENLGGLLTSTINDLKVDLDDNLWVAFSQGVGFIPNISFTLQQNNEGLFFPVNLIQPIFEDGLLFRDEEILSLAVDGGSRKWMGTNRGVWLFNTTGDELFDHFTVENSILPENAISTIGINQVSGEVFFATSAGLVSYRSDATIAENTYQDVKVFPNPVRPDYSGNLTISGLASDAVVKISTPSGYLVYKAQAYGGTFTWSMISNNGKRIGAGVYLVFSNSPDGEETFVTKFAVVN